MPSQQPKGKKWSTEILSFTDHSLISILCFPYTACKTSKRFGESFFLPLLDMYGLFAPVTISTRASMRNRYGIEGTIFEDIVTSFCCCPCVWSQMSRELDIRESNGR